MFVLIATSSATEFLGTHSTSGFTPVSVNRERPKDQRTIQEVLPSIDEQHRQRLISQFFRNIHLTQIRREIEKALIYRGTKESRRFLREVVNRDLTYDEAVVWRELKLETNLRFSDGFWKNKDTAINMILVALDTIDGFKEAREEQPPNIKKMAELYRTHVIKYKSKKNLPSRNQSEIKFEPSERPVSEPANNGKKKRNRKNEIENGQKAFFEEVGGLAGLMSNKHKLCKKGKSPAELLRLAIKGLIDVRNPDALDPNEVEDGYWDDKENARYHFYLAMDTIPNFTLFRETYEYFENRKGKYGRKLNEYEIMMMNFCINQMANLYRTSVNGYDLKSHWTSTGSAQGFFYKVGGLRSLMANKRDFLDKTGSPAALLRCFLGYLVDQNNPYALRTCEIEQQKLNK